VFACFYTFVTAAAWIVALPFFLLVSLKSKYRYSVPARFFLRHNPPLKADGVWFHCCSFGEARAVAPLAERFETERLRMSAATRTGWEVIRSLAPRQSRYLPFEPLLWFWIRPQKALVVMEAELWYLLFFIAKRRGAKTLLINARISERSWPKYRRFSWLYRRVFAKVDLVYAQTETDRARLETLGARHVEVTGNLKLSAVPEAKGLLSKPEERYVICAGSTHEGEEGEILAGFREFKRHHPEAMMVVVPRHPERFDKVWRMMEAMGRLHDWEVSRFSERERLDGDLVLMDRMGMLVECYSVSDLAVLGGAFGPFGGHNAAEAAQFGIPIVSGPHYFNQKDLFGGIEGITVVPKEKLAETMRYPGLLTPSRLKFSGDALDRIEKEIRSVL